MGSLRWQKLEVEMGFSFDQSETLLTHCMPLSPMSLAIFQHSAAITLSFLLSYGINHFQVSFFHFPESYCHRILTFS